MTRISYEEALERDREYSSDRNRPTMNRRNSRKRWTSEEERLLFDESLTIEEMALLLERSIASISQRKLRIGATESVRKWSEEELELARDMSLSDKELAELLDRSFESVRGKREKLRSKGDLETRRDVRAYSDEDNEFIADDSFSVEELSELFGVSKKAISSKRYLMRKASGKVIQKHRYSEDEIEVLLDESLTDEECSELLGRPVGGVSKKRYNLKKKLALV